MATADITVLPIGREGASVGDLLVEVEKHLSAQDKVKYELHAMGTSLEGELEDILRIAGELHGIPFESGIPRVYTVLKIDQRTDKDQTLASKVKSVTDRL